jgi:hypothetical protein
MVAQQPGMADTAALRRTLNQQLNQLKKTLRCVTNGEECTEQEISQARFLVGKIVVGIILLGGLILGGIKKGIPMWQQWQTKQKTQKTVREEALRNLTKDQLIFYASIVAGKINAATKQLEDDLAITQYVAQAIAIALQSDNKKAGKLYTKIQKLADQLGQGDGIQKLNFTSEEADKELWKVFANARVIPKNRQTQTQFYRWGGGMEQKPSSVIPALKKPTPKIIKK